MDITAFAGMVNVVACAAPAAGGVTITLAVIPDTMATSPGASKANVTRNVRVTGSAVAENS